MSCEDCCRDDYLGPLWQKKSLNPILNCYCAVGVFRSHKRTPGSSAYSSYGRIIRYLTLNSWRLTQIQSLSHILKRSSQPSGKVLRQTVECSKTYFQHRTVTIKEFFPKVKFRH
jgi:hypothetical protein